jgi:hypothetical protein
VPSTRNINSADLLSAHEFRGGTGCCVGEHLVCVDGCGGFQGAFFGWSGSIIGANGGVIVVRIFGAVARHVPLKLAPKAPSFLGQLSTLFWGKFLEWDSICSVNVHGDVIQIRMTLVQLIVCVGSVIPGVT